jgi:PadR family transcriptional regulator PadR
MRDIAGCLTGKNFEDSIGYRYRHTISQKGEFMIRDLYLGFMRLHILYHASEEPIFGVGMLNELRRHGYRTSPGTLYPMLHRMEKDRYLESEKQVVGGKVRRVYRITDEGTASLAEAKEKVWELFTELFERELPKDLRRKRSTIPDRDSIGDR